MLVKVDPDVEVRISRNNYVNAFDADGQASAIAWWSSTVPDSKVHGDNMGSIWGQRDPGGPHVGPMDFAIWGGMAYIVYTRSCLPQRIKTTCAL